MDLAGQHLVLDFRLMGEQLLVPQLLLVHLAVQVLQDADGARHVPEELTEFVAPRHGLGDARSALGDAAHLVAQGRDAAAEPVTVGPHHEQCGEHGQAEDAGKAQARAAQRARRSGVRGDDGKPLHALGDVHFALTHEHLLSAEDLDLCVLPAASGELAGSIKRLPLPVQTREHF